MNLNEIFAQVKLLSIDDQRALNKVLVANINRTQKMKSMVAAQKFNIGDKVVFDAGRKGGLTVIEVNGFSRDGANLKGRQVGGFRSGCLWTVGAAQCNKA